MLAAIFYQSAAALVVIILASIFVGVKGSVSAGLAAAACILPNLLFALRLKSVMNRPGASFPGSFFIGELVKVLATAGLLVLAARVYAELHWPSFVASMVIVLQSGFIAFWKKS